METKSNKIAIVAFGHVDVTVPLFQKLNENNADVDLILCFALNKRGESILRFNQPDLKPGFVNKTCFDNILLENRLNNLAFKNKILLFLYFNLKLISLNNFVLSLKLSNHLRKYKVIHFTGEDGVLPILILFLRLLNKRIIITIHDFFPHSGSRITFFTKLWRKYLIWSNHDVIIQNNTDYNSVIKQYSPKKKNIYTIPFGSLEIYKTFLGESLINKNEIKSDILFFGLISPYKGIKYLIEASKKIILSLPNVKISIAGSGKFDFDITPYAKHPNFTIINRYLSNGDVADLVANTKVVVCPYTDATQSGVVMTAFAFEKPVIASSVGGFVDVIHPNVNGFLVPPKDASMLANSILSLLENDDMLEKLKQNIIDFKTTGEYSWDTIVGKYLSLYFPSKS